MSNKISLQLFTLREELNEDFIGTLKKVAEMGYQGVEFGGYTGGYTGTELKNLLENVGLKASGTHVGLDVIKNNIEETIDFNLQLGSSYIILPWTCYTLKKEYLELAEICNIAGEKCKNKGIQFCYHNHHREFIKLNGKNALDILFDHCDPEFVKAEMDVYWVKYAGIDPVEYIKKYKNRCPLIHLKDMEDNEDGDFAEVGTGILDIRGIAAAAKEIEVEWLVVEQDRCKRPAIESVEISANNLKKMNLL